MTGSRFRYAVIEVTNAIPKIESSSEH